ncbi:MAG: hypothetical protein ABI828_02815 [Actinomycetota bacterium]
MLAHAGNADESMSLIMAFTGLWVGWAGWSRLRGNGFPRMSRPVAFVCIGVALAFIVAATIVPRILLGPKPGTIIPAGARPRSTATLAIEEPKPGASVSGGQLNVIAKLTGGTIVQATSTDLTPSTGHLHLSIDGKLASMTYGTVQILNISSLEPGLHTLTAEFVAADHAPFNPRVVATATFTKAGP